MVAGARGRAPAAGRQAVRGSASEWGSVPARVRASAVVQEPAPAGEPGLACVLVAVRGWATARDREPDPEQAKAMEQARVRATEQAPGQEPAEAWALQPGRARGPEPAQWGSPVAVMAQVPGPEKASVQPAQGPEKALERREPAMALMRRGAPAGAAMVAWGRRAGLA